MLHFERKKARAVAEAEARGEDVWTGKFEDAVRVKIDHALREAADGADAWVMACDAAQRTLAKALGKHRLTKVDLSQVSLTRWLAADYLQYLQECPDEMMPSVIEAAFVGLSASTGSIFGAPAYATTENFRTSVKTILERHRILWDLVGDEMIELKSKELHSGVVEPAVRLLAGRQDLAAVERAYQEALREVSANEPDNAITKAGTALQEMLRACGCKGNAIGDLAASARQKGLIAPHDTRLAIGVQNIMEWVAADRSEKGGSHVVANPSKEDAWLTIHVVGALIVRLAVTEKR